MLEEAFGRRVVDANALQLDGRAHRPERGLWLATILLDGVAQARAGRWERILCPDPRCVMWFSNTLVETDRKGARFCARHAAALRRVSPP